MVLKKCRFCGEEKEYNHWRDFASHCGNCKANPNYAERINKQKKAQRKKRTLVKQICPICKKSFTLELTEAQIKDNRYRKHCSRHCASIKIVSLETRQKISESLRGKKRGSPSKEKKNYVKN